VVQKPAIDRVRPPAARLCSAGAGEIGGSRGAAQKLDTALTEEVGCPHRIIQSGDTGGHVGRRAPLGEPGAMIAQLASGQPWHPVSWFWPWHPPGLPCQPLPCCT